MARHNVMTQLDSLDHSIAALLGNRSLDGVARCTAAQSGSDDSARGLQRSVTRFGSVMYGGVPSSTFYFTKYQDTVLNVYFLWYNVFKTVTDTTARTPLQTAPRSAAFLSVQMRGAS